MPIDQNIYTYIKSEEARFNSEEIKVGDNWSWNFKNHVQMIFHLKNGQFFTGENNFLRAFNNIMEPILNLSYWSEDIEVKDIVFYIEEENGRVLSFLIKKYHDEVFVKENNIDTLLDEITEDDVDYGGVLVQKGEKRPEVIYLPSIAFCDQTDMEGGPMAFKYNFSPDKLRQMASKGWGDEKNGATISIDDLIVLAEPVKDSGGQDNKTTGKNIEVYIVRGSLPEHYLKDNDNMEDYYNQIHIVGFYTGENSKQEGVTLLRLKESESGLKFHTSKKIYGRALGRGVGEGLLHPQIWTNFLEIHKMNMLEAGSKVLPYTDDDAFANRNNLQDKENLEMSTIEEGKVIRLIPTIEPAKIQLFEGSINSFFEQAQTIGSAFDPMLGKEQASGTTFRGQERTVAQGRGLHDRRRGQRAKFIEELYRWDIIPRMTKKILGGTKFLATLTTEEMNWTSERMIENYANKRRNEQVLSGELPTEKEVLMEEASKKFKKVGNKWLINILKNEFKNVEIKIGINVASKQKNLIAMTDKILSIFQFIFSNPQGFQQVMQMSGMSAAFNDILEFSGISGVDFSNIGQLPAQQAQPAVGAKVPQTLNG
uniref:Portal protein n=1 Tax=viral metagenome TaxID=1070528 RepID=A0A6M3XTG6_9ZZZZ